jgi:Helix-hairpin-helix motif
MALKLSFKRMKDQKKIIEFLTDFSYSDSYRNSATFTVSKISVLIIIFVTSFGQLSGQSEKLSDNIIQIAEELAADDSDPEAVSTFIDRLEELSENPVKINSSSVNDLSRLFFLSDFQVKALADYSHTTGQIVSIYELAAIPGFDQQTVEMMIPFITLDHKNINKPDSTRFHNSLITNFSFKPGQNDTISLGSCLRILSKYKFSSGGFSGGLTAEKDPGEKLISGTPPLPDFFSAHLAFNGNGVIKRIIIGDYSARYGLGTNINTGIRRGISLTSPGFMSASDEIKPYTSTEENKFFRGIAAEFSLKKLGFSLFFSKNKADATIDSTSGQPQNYIDNFYTAGIHNTPSLLHKKDAISEIAYGAALACNFDNLKLGFISSESRLSLPMAITVNDPGKIYDFTGSTNDIFTFYYSGFIRKILLYGEFSINNMTRLAIVQGISFRPSDRISFNFLYRSYNTGYTTFYGLGPGTGSKSANETGLLGNFTFEAAKHLFISGGYDIQHFPWIKYRCSSPSIGVRREIRMKYIPTGNLTLDASFTYHLSMTDSSDSRGIPDVKNTITKNIKISSRYSLPNSLILGTRIDFSLVTPSGSRGVLLFQEIIYTFKRVPVTLWARYCLFSTNDWDSRLYTYENDLLYGFSIPALYGEGSRSYIMVKWKTGDIAELRIKYAITSSVAAGKSFRNSDEIKMQFRIFF